MNIVDNSDVLLGTYTHEDDLQVGSEYSRTVQVWIPNAIYGRFSIIVITDVRNMVYEHVNDNDNAGVAKVY